MMEGEGAGTDTALNDLRPDGGGEQQQRFLLRVGREVLQS